MATDQLALGAAEAGRDRRQAPGALEQHAAGCLLGQLLCACVRDCVSASLLQACGGLLHTEGSDMSQLPHVQPFRRLGHGLQAACIGVTTGQLLCACVGSRERAEYTVYGDAINLSARLMMKAAGGLGSVLCDRATQVMAPAAASFTKLDPIHVSLHARASVWMLA